MAKKIKGITDNFGDWPSIVGRKMMVRYANEDWDYDVVRHVDRMIWFMGDKANKQWAYAKHILNYWTYKFLLAQGNEDEAMFHLKKSFKENGPDAMAQYAYFYYTGQEITNTVDIKKANKLFDKAFEQKSMFVEYLYAEAITYKNENNKEVLKKAIPYYEEALKKGVLFARYKLANCYLKTGQKLDEAEKLFAKCDEPEAKDRIKEIEIIRMQNKKRK